MTITAKPAIETYRQFEIATSDRNLPPGTTGQSVNETAWWWRWASDSETQCDWRRSGHLQGHRGGGRWVVNLSDLKIGACERLEELKHYFKAPGALRATLVLRDPSNPALTVFVSDDPDPLEAIAVGMDLPPGGRE